MFDGLSGADQAAVASAGVVPSVRWHLGSLAVVWLAGTAGFVWLLLIAAQPRKAASFRPQPRLFAAAAGVFALIDSGLLAVRILAGEDPTRVATCRRAIDALSAALAKSSRGGR
mgnify:CR=1 FL=1